MVKYLNILFYLIFTDIIFFKTLTGEHEITLALSCIPFLVEEGWYFYLGKPNTILSLCINLTCKNERSASFGLCVEEPFWLLLVALWTSGLFGQRAPPFGLDQQRVVAAGVLARLETHESIGVAFAAENGYKMDEKMVKNWGTINEK